MRILVETMEVSKPWEVGSLPGGRPTCIRWNMYLGLLLWWGVIQFYHKGPLNRKSLTAWCIARVIKF